MFRLPNLKLVLTATFLLGALAFPIASSEAPEDRILTPAQIASDVALAEEAYSRIHPGYTRYATEDGMRGAWQSLLDEAAAAGGMSLGDFYLQSNRVLARIRCDHTKAELPKILAEARKTDPVYLPMRWEVIEGRGFVSIPGEGSGLEYGDEIIAIDGQALSERIDAVLPYLPYDGNTDWVRYNEAAQSYEFRGGGVDHFGALIWESNATANLTIKRANQEPQDIEVTRITHPEWRKLVAGEVGPSNFKDAVSFKRIGKNAGYLRVDTFVNYRTPVKPDTLYDPVFKALKDEGRDTLIVDLRRNGGGSNDAANRLAAHLMSKKAPMMKDIRVKTLNHKGLEEHLTTWDSRALSPNRLGFTTNDDSTYSMRAFVNEDLKAIKPDKTAFKGQLILLTSSKNSSGSTHLLTFIKDKNPDALMIGETTGGSSEGATAGVIFYLKLPESGITMRIPFMQSFVNADAFEAGLGVTPDIQAPMTIQAFLDQRDPALERALSEAGVSQDFDISLLK